MLGVLIRSALMTYVCEEIKKQHILDYSSYPEVWQYDIFPSKATCNMQDCYKNLSIGKKQL